MWKAFRAAAPGLILTAAAIAYVIAQRRGITLEPGSASGPARARSAYEARTDELLRLNAGMASEPALAARYDAINARYFDNRLPDVRIRWEPRLGDAGPLIADGFRLDGLTNGRLILLDPAIERDEPVFRRTLCHEMVHVAVHGQDNGHGPVFQRELRRLSAEGAFSGIVATEEAKDAMRRGVEIAAGNLEGELTDLVHERAALNRDSAAADRQAGDLNRRIAGYNARVQRHNDAVRELNDRIGQYNLMISYPDGLDRERLQRREALSPER